MKNQLLYLWIRRTDYPCFENNEFNFSSYFSFHFDYNNQILTEEPIDSINIFDQDNISNITAIIGDNGAGKTALLTSLFDILEKKITRMDLIDSCVKNLTDHFIAVFLIGGRFVILNRSIRSIVFKSETEQRNVEILTNEVDFCDLSIVYFSLEDKIPNRIDANKERGVIVLNPKQMLEDRYKFFVNKIYPGLKEYVDYKTFDFEKFWDTYSYAKNNKCIESNDRINISFNLYSEIRIHERDIFSGTEKYTTANIINDYSLTSFLFFNFLTELQDWSKISFLAHELVTQEMTREECQSVIDYLTSTYSDFNQPEIKKYICRGLDEIFLFAELSKKQRQYFDGSNNGLNYVIDYTISVGELDELFDLILSEGPSFLFKYLKFDTDRSDGEMAKIRQIGYLEYLARREYLIPHSERLKNNILLLMDEIDVHLHPNEQRKLISSIIKCLKRFFQGKTVQLIFTSHSPIVLSDIPSQNIIYVKKEKESDKRRVYRQLDVRTFGANIFDLYNDSFFFDDKALMGEFAKEYIDNLYKQISSRDAKERGAFLKQIDMIGETIIRNELQRLVTERNEKSRTKVDPETINLLKEQRDSLDSLIKRMEELNND